MPKILVNYRRDDSAAYAGRLADRLRDHFGRENVFVDIDTIRPGEDFVERIDQSIAACDVLVAVIGKSWLTAVDPQGRRRLDREDDFVRTEIAKALERHIRVIPALVGDAGLPEAAQLPQDSHARVLTQAARRPRVANGDNAEPAPQDADRAGLEQARPGRPLHGLGARDQVATASRSPRRSFLRAFQR